MQGRSTGSIFPLLDEKENIRSKESKMMKADEGRTRAKALDQRRRRTEVFVMDFFCLEITQNVSFFLSWSTEERKQRYVVTDRRIRRWFCF